MYFIQCTVRRPRAASTAARCWVNVEAETQVRQRLQEHLATQDCELVAIEAVQATTRSDYFAPCRSLDAFERAQSEGVHCLIDS